MRYLLIKIKAAKPAISEVQFDLLAQPSLRANTVAVAHDQHPDHELGVNRRPADVAVKGRQLLMQIGHDPRYFWIDPAQQMAFWNTPFEIEEVKQLALIATLPTHHDPPPPLTNQAKENHGTPIITTPFSTASTQSGHASRSRDPFAGSGTVLRVADVFQPID